MKEKTYKLYFRALRKKYLEIFREKYKDITLPNKSSKALVIVEPRIHENLEFTIKNIAYYCKGWSLYIFHSKENKKLIEKILAHNLTNTNLIEFSEGNITRDEYCNLLYSVDRFWNKIDADMILIFQTDAYIRRRGIEDFLHYDYVGAPWAYSNHTEFSDLEFDIGNGGLSLRRKSVMIEILKQNPPDKEVNEDLYFSYWCSKLNYKKPNKDEAMKVFVEQIYYHDPIGLHQPNIFNNIKSNFPPFKNYMNSKKKNIFQCEFYE